MTLKFLAVSFLQRFAVAPWLPNFLDSRRLGSYDALHQRRGRRMIESYQTAPVGGAFLIEPATARDPFIYEDFTPDEIGLADTGEEFVGKEVLPHLEDIEHKKDGLMPSLLRRAGELGLLMVEVPAEYGGLGLSKAVALLVAARTCECGSFSVSMNAHTGIGTLPLVFYGNDEQRARYLPKLAAGEWLGAYALTEPAAGSDAMSAKARAVLSADGRSYRLNGVKQFITNAAFADLFTVFAKVDGDKFTAFLVERTSPGLSIGPEEHKMGILGSSTCQVILDDVEVPVENVLGAIGQGHKIAFNILNLGRLKLGGIAAGGARKALELAVTYAAGRRQFGKPIATFGAIQRKIADMMARIYAADSVSYRTAGLIDAAIRPPPPTGSRCNAPLRSTPSSNRFSRSTAARRWISRWMRDCRSTVAMASSRSIRWLDTIATPASIASSRAPTRSTAC
jgi:alkylation response protein AidB-like acyl-CoA dehydrogenase